MKLKDLIERYNEAIESAEEYEMSENSGTADFVSSLGYGEVTLDAVDSMRVDDEVKDLIKFMFQRDGHATISSLIECSELELANIYFRDNEIFSVTIGEQEHQPDDELIEAYKKLKPKSLAAFKKQVKGYVSDGPCKGWIYTSNDYDRWVMILDTDKFMETHGPKQKPSLKPIQGDALISRKSTANLKLVS